MDRFKTFLRSLLLLILFKNVAGEENITLKQNRISENGECGIICQYNNIYESIRCSCHIQPSCNLLFNEKPTAFRKLIVDFHNEMRNKVAKGLEKRLKTKAANMEVINYDNNLEIVASCHAARCTISDRVCTESLPDAKKKLLNTIHLVRGTKEVPKLDLKYIRSIFEEMYEELNDASKQFVKYVDNVEDHVEVGTDHLRTIILAKTNRVGCGVAHHEQADRVFLTCLYYPAELTKHKAIFLRGQPCSCCPPKTFCNSYYTGLCGNLESVPDLPMVDFYSWNGKLMMIVIITNLGMVIVFFLVLFLLRRNIKSFIKMYIG